MKAGQVSDEQIVLEGACHSCRHPNRARQVEFNLLEVHFRSIRTRGGTCQMPRCDGRV